MKKNLLFKTRLTAIVTAILFSCLTVTGQSYLVGPPDPYIGTNANYTSHNHYNTFDVLEPNGVYLDSITIYPATASAPYTIVVQNSSQVQIGSFSGITTIGGNQAERIKANIFVPFGTGYRLGLTTSSVGMLRNSAGTQFPYTVPGVISLTGSTFTTGGVTYWYFFYNLLVTVPVYETDAGISEISSPSDTVCSGLQPVDVTLNNYGPSDLAEVKIRWKVNDVMQPEYNWTGALTPNNSATVTIGDYDFLTGTAYEIVAWTHEPNGLTDTINNLNDTATAAGIFVHPSPTAAFTTPNTIICQGDSIAIEGTMTGTAPWTIVIDDGTTVHTLSNLQTGSFSEVFSPMTLTNYILTSVTDQTGCEAIINDTVEVAAMPAPPALINVIGSAGFCAGDSTTLMASVGLGFSYEWFIDGVMLPDDTTYVLTAKLPGDYTVKVISPNGCHATSAPTTITVHPLPSVFLGNDTALLPTQTILLDAGPGFNSYQWNTGATSQMITVDSSGIGIGVKTIFVHVTDNFYCIGGATININFTQHPGINEAFANAELLVIPNPSDGRIELHLANIPAGDYVIEAISPDGKLIFKSKHQINNDNIFLDLSHLAKGVYLLKLTGNAGTVTERIVIR